MSKPKLDIYNIYLMSRFREDRWAYSSWVQATNSEVEYKYRQYVRNLDGNILGSLDHQVMVF